MNEKVLDENQDLDSIELIQLVDGWNTGRFSINLNRCRDCEKHASTNRHQE